MAQPDCHTFTVNAPLLILDSATLYYRAYYALPESLSAPDGHPNNAIRGFFSMLSKLSVTHNPRGLVAAWDTDWRPEWRVALLPSYKAHRVADSDDETEDIPDTLGPQIDAIAQLLDACGIARIGFENFEADDVIASVAAQEQPASLVVTSDKDLMQVVSHKTSLLLQSKGGVDAWPIIGPHEVRERFGVAVEQYVDYATLRGDPSDGLPGISGIGEKTAASLISKHQSLEALIEAANTQPIEKPLTPKMAERIIAGTDYLFSAREVITAETDLPVSNWQVDIPDEPRDRQNLNYLAKAWGVERTINDWFTRSRDTQ